MFYSIFLSSYCRNLMSGKSQMYHKYLHLALQTVNLPDPEAEHSNVCREKTINLHEYIHRHLINYVRVKKKHFLGQRYTSLSSIQVTVAHFGLEFAFDLV